MAYVLVVNGAAGSADRDASVAALRVLHEASEHADLVETSSPDELFDVARAVEAGDVLVACGGDGSIHALVNAVRQVQRLDEVEFGLVPMGTGNDLARALGIPWDDTQAAARVLLDGAPRRLDLLVSDRRSGPEVICLNALHGGVGVEAAAKADALKDSLGKAAYPLGALAAGATADGWTVTVEVDDEVLHDEADGPVLLVAVCNATGFGGGTVVAPDAIPNDGLLDVVFTTAVGPVERAAFGAALARGTHLDRDDVRHATGTRVRVHGARIGWNVDGDLDERGTTDTTFRVEAGAWTLLTPTQPRT